MFYELWISLMLSGDGLYPEILYFDKVFEKLSIYSSTVL